MSYICADPLEGERRIARPPKKTCYSIASCGLFGFFLVFQALAGEGGGKTSSPILGLPLKVKTKKNIPFNAVAAVRAGKKERSEARR